MQVQTCVLSANNRNPTLVTGISKSRGRWEKKAQEMARSQRRLESLGHSQSSYPQLWARSATAAGL